MEALTPGVRLGPYEIESAIGMGEVYRARDTRLDRNANGQKLEPGVPVALFATRTATGTSRYDRLSVTGTVTP